MAQSLDTNFILERSIQQLVKFIFLSFILALALTRKPLLPLSLYCFLQLITNSSSSVHSSGHGTSYASLTYFKLRPGQPPCVTGSVSHKQKASPCKAVIMGMRSQ